MLRLTQTQVFAEWVSNAVHAVSGIMPDFIDLDGECLLTYVQSRMGACQVGFEDSFDSAFQASMRSALIVPTHMRVLH